MSTAVVEHEQEQEQASVQAAPPPALDELKARIQAGLDTYAKREEAIAAIERALTKARKSEAEGLEQSLTSDDPKIIRRISDARIEIEVQSRRKTVAQQSLPNSLEGARQGIIDYYQALIARVDELVASRLNTHRRFFAARLDLESFRAQLVSVGLGAYMQNPTLLIAQHTPDVIAAGQCKPRFVWAINGAYDGTGITAHRLREDIERLTECENALAAEASKVYDFTPQSES